MQWKFLIVLSFFLLLYRMFQRKNPGPGLLVSLPPSSESSVVTIKTELPPPGQPGGDNGDSYVGLPPAKRIRHESSNNDWGDSESSPGSHINASQGFTFTSPPGSLDDPYSPHIGKSKLFNHRKLSLTRHLHTFKTTFR